MGRKRETKALMKKERTEEGKVNKTGRNRERKQEGKLKSWKENRGLWEATEKAREGENEGRRNGEKTENRGQW